MALVNWILDTQAGSLNIGEVRSTVTPRAGTTSGFVAFGVTAPNGAVIKAINPNFSATPNLFFDVQFANDVAQTVDVANLLLDSAGAYMSGIYTLSVSYRFIGVYPGLVTADDQDLTIQYNFCITNSIGNTNKAVLVSTVDSLNNVVRVSDNTDYTGLTIATHQISSVLSTGGAAIIETGYVQTLALGSWVSTLTANASRTSTTAISNVTVNELITVTATINSPTDFSTYKAVIDKAEVVLNAYDAKLCNKKGLSEMERNNWLCIMSQLVILNSRKALGYDISNNLRILNNLLR